jgi:uncharacterized protein YkwD
VPALAWSSQLAAEAQQWADACPSNGFKHSPGAWQGENGYGENLSWGTNQSAQGAVDNWYREISQDNFNAPAYSNAVGHFTQLIWRNSKQLGCGMSVCNGAGHQCLVCFRGELKRLLGLRHVLRSGPSRTP